MDIPRYPKYQRKFVANRSSLLECVCVCVKGKGREEGEEEMWVEHTAVMYTTVVNSNISGMLSTALQVNWSAHLAAVSGCVRGDYNSSLALAWLQAVEFKVSIFGEMHTQEDSKMQQHVMCQYCSSFY